MAQQLVSEFVLNMSGNMATKAKQYGGAMNRLARNNSRAMTIMKNSTREASRALDKIQNRYTGAASAFVTGSMVKGVADFDKVIRRMGTNAQMSDAQVARLKQSIKETANQGDLHIDMGELAAGVDELQSKTGNLKFVESNIRNIGLAMQGFGVDSKVAAHLLAQFYEKGITGADDVEKTMDQLFGQFAKGSLNVADIARVAPSLFSIIADKGPEAIAQMGGLAQIFAKNKGSAEEVVTSIQGVYAALSDKKNIEFLKNEGVDVFVKGTQDIKKPVELINEVLEAAHYNRLNLQDVFTGTDMEGLSAMLKPENRQLLNDMVHGTYTLGATQQAAEKNAKGFYGAMGALNNTLLDFADAKLADPINDLAAAIGALDSDTVKTGLEVLVASAGVIGGALAVRGSYRMGKGMYDVGSRIFGKKGAGKNGGSAGAFGLDVQKVYVVNMGMGGMNGGTKTSLGPNRTTTRSGRFSKMMNLGEKVAGPLAVSQAVASMVMSVMPDWVHDADAKFTTRVKAAFGDTEAKQQMVQYYGADPKDYGLNAQLQLQLQPQQAPMHSSDFNPQVNGRIDVNVTTSHDGRKPLVTVNTSGLPGQAMVN